MEQHPVPQPITSYEFRLVGDMTLKQFGKLAAGVCLALLVYAINPPALIKWFLIFLFSGVGAAAAFVPFEGRPIDVWIIAFFKRIYSPTQYVWRQKGSLSTSVPPAAKTVSAPVTPLSPPPLARPAAAPPPISPSIKTTPTVPPIKISPVIETIFKAPVAKPPLPPPPPSPRPPSISTAARVEAKFSAMPIPATPSINNLLVGFVHDRQGKIVEGAILEIRDASGNPVRAFKTNKLGQFQSATPLPGGTYEIETEKEGLVFDIIKVNLEGKVMPPIEIVSK